MDIDMLGKYFFLLYYNSTPPFEINKADADSFFNAYDIFEGKQVPRSIRNKLKKI